MSHPKRRSLNRRNKRNQNNTTAVPVLRAEVVRVGDGSLESRVKGAILQARRLRDILKHGDRDALAEATLLQGVISGDVISAGILTRQRLQRENLRLRARYSKERIKTERVKRLMLETITGKMTPAQRPTEDTFRRIAEIYGLNEPEEKQHFLTEGTLDPPA